MTVVQISSLDSWPKFIGADYASFWDVGIFHGGDNDDQVGVAGRGEVAQMGELVHEAAHERPHLPLNERFRFHFRFRGFGYGRKRHEIWRGVAMATSRNDVIVAETRTKECGNLLHQGLK